MAAETPKVWTRTFLGSGSRVLISSSRSRDKCFSSVIRSTSRTTRRDHAVLQSNTTSANYLLFGPMSRQNDGLKVASTSDTATFQDLTLRNTSAAYAE